MQRAWVQSLVRELIPHGATRDSHAPTKDPACCSEDPVQPNKKNFKAVSFLKLAFCRNKPKQIKRKAYEALGTTQEP